MKKIMFSDKYCLTQAVLAGTKTMTRRKFVRFEPDARMFDEICNIDGGFDDKGRWIFTLYNKDGDIIGDMIPHYNIGEVVAIAQSYKSIADERDEAETALDLYKIGDNFLTMDEMGAGWNNKMFVKADLMPHHIRITDVKIERLQELSDEDCTKEGVGAFLKVICEKASEEYEKKSDNIYWITGRGYDQSLSYCYNCARKEVEALNQEIGKGYEKYIVDGGWGVEDEHPCFCEKCGKPLLFDFCGNVDLELPNLDLRYESNLYILNQILSQDDEDAEKVIRYFAREAFASLIDKISGKGTWESNPWVVAYSFELVD